MSASGYKRTYSGQLANVRFTPESRHYRRKFASGFNDERAALEKVNDSLTRRVYERARNVRRGFVLGFLD